MVRELSVHVTVVYSPAPREVKEIPLTLKPGATVAQALMASGLQALFPEQDMATAVVGVWSHKASPDRVLCEQDRVEVYRPLKVNPKVARRERFAKQGSRGAGLFAKTRTGGKAGY